MSCQVSPALLRLYSCFTHALLMLYSYFTHTLLELPGFSCFDHASLMLCSCFTHALLILYAHCTHTALIVLCSCFTRALRILYATHTVLVLYSSFLYSHLGPRLCGAPGLQRRRRPHTLLCPQAGSTLAAGVAPVSRCRLPAAGVLWLRLGRAVAPAVLRGTPRPAGSVTSCFTSCFTAVLLPAFYWLVYRGAPRPAGSVTSCCALLLC
jgi:hypothetical protein